MQSVCDGLDLMLKDRSATDDCILQRVLKFGLLITPDNITCYLILIFLVFGALPSMLLIVQLFTQERSRQSK